MNDPLESIRTSIQAAAGAHDSYLRTLESSLSKLASVDPLASSPAMRAIQDFAKQEELRRAWLPENSLSETIRKMQADEEQRRVMLGFSETSVERMLHKAIASQPWIDNILASTKPAWWEAMTANETTGFKDTLLQELQRSEETYARYFKTTASHASTVSALSESILSRVNPISDILKPAIETDRPIASILERLGLTSSSKLQDIYDPPAFRSIRETIESIQFEQHSFLPNLRNVESPWNAIDWQRLQRVVEETDALAKQATEPAELADISTADAIPADVEEQFAQAMRPVVEGIEAEVSSIDERREGQEEAINRIVDSCEAILAKQYEQDRRLDAQDAKIAKHEKSVSKAWINQVLMFLVQTAWALALAWMSSHTTPKIDQTLAYLHKPVTSETRTAEIRSDAATAVAPFGLSENETSSLYVVTKRVLRVNTWPRSSETSDLALNSGQVVTIIWRQDHWRYIGWCDAESGEYKNGWVKARHLSKLGN